MVQMLQSWLKLPLWINIWVWVFLVPVNIAPFFFLETTTGFSAAIAAGFVAVANSFFLLANRGLTKILAIPHLIAWIPLLSYIAYRWLIGSGYESGSPEAVLALVLFVINGISLGFDVYDTAEWSKGNRSIPGFPDANVRF